jgi:hypothetical protein
VDAERLAFFGLEDEPRHGAGGYPA